MRISKIFLSFNFNLIMWLFAFIQFENVKVCLPTQKRTKCLLWRNNPTSSKRINRWIYSHGLWCQLRTSRNDNLFKYHFLSPFVVIMFTSNSFKLRHRLNPQCKVNSSSNSISSNSISRGWSGTVVRHPNPNLIFRPTTKSLLLLGFLLDYKPTWKTYLFRSLFCTLSIES